MTKSAWVIMKQGDSPVSIVFPRIHMVGFASKKEAESQCALLDERATNLFYYIEQAKVFTKWEP